MNLNNFQDLNLIDKINKIDINSFIQEITERLEMMEQKLVIDRFEGNIAICEDINTKKIYEIDRNQLPSNAKESNVIQYKDGKYQIDTQLENKTSKRIKKKMDDIWN